MIMMVSISYLMAHIMTTRVTISTKRALTTTVAFTIKKRENMLIHMNSSRRTTKNLLITMTNFADQVQMRTRMKTRMVTKTQMMRMRKKKRTIITFQKMRPTRASGENIASQPSSGSKINQKIK